MLHKNPSTFFARPSIVTNATAVGLCAYDGPGCRSQLEARRRLTKRYRKQYDHGNPAATKECFTSSIARRRLSTDIISNSLHCMFPIVDTTMQIIYRNHSSLTEQSYVFFTVDTTTQIVHGNHL